MSWEPRSVPPASQWLLSPALLLEQRHWLCLEHWTSPPAKLPPKFLVSFLQVLRWPSYMIPRYDLGCLWRFGRTNLLLHPWDRPSPSFRCPSPFCWLLWHSRLWLSLRHIFLRLLLNSWVSFLDPSARHSLSWLLHQVFLPSLQHPALHPCMPWCLLAEWWVLLCMSQVCWDHLLRLV